MIKPVEFVQCVAPIFLILKRDGSIQICGDYKVIMNMAAKRDSYPLSRIRNIFASLTGGKSFLKLDMAHASQQNPLEESFKKLVVINMQKGLFLVQLTSF